MMRSLLIESFHRQLICVVDVLMRLSRGCTGDPVQGDTCTGGFTKSCEEICDSDLCNSRANKRNPARTTPAINTANTGPTSTASQSKAPCR